MRLMRYVLLIVSILLWAPGAWSHDDSDARNRVSLQVEARREVPNDWATARLAVVAEGKEPAKVANAVNQKMQVALAAVKRVKGMEPQTGAYVSHPVHDDGRIVRWRARQELRVESGDVERLSGLIGELQAESVLLSGIEFSVRPTTRVAHEDELIGEALAAFRSRASRIAEGMKAKDWSLIAMSVGRAGGSPRRVAMRADAEMMSMSKVAPPALEAGTREILIRVDGTVELD